MRSESNKIQAGATTSTFDGPNIVSEAERKNLTGTGRIDALNQLAWSLRRFDVNRASEYANEALEESRQLNYAAGEGEALLVLGTLAWLSSHDVDAFDYFQQSLILMRATGNRAREAGVLYRLGNVLVRRGDYGDGLRHFQDAQRIYEQLGDDRGVANVLICRGSVCMYERDFPAMLHHLQAALALYKKLDDSQGTSMALNNLSLCHQELGDLAAALSDSRKALAIKEAIQDERGMAICYNNMGGIYNEMGAYEKGRDFHQRSLHTWATRGGSGQAEALLGLAESHRGLADLEQALAYLDQAMALAKQHELPEIQVRILHKFSEIRALQGDFEQALTDFQEAAKIESELLNKEKNKIISELRARFEIEKSQREAEIYRLRHERLARELKIARQIQSGLLPLENPVVRGLNVAGYCLPAREVGGDYYDFIQIPGSDLLFVVISDVSGKGVPASLLSIAFRTLVRALIAANLPLVDILALANTHLFQDINRVGQPMFISALVMCWNPQESELTYVNAAHDPFLLHRTGQDTCERIWGGGMWLGVEPDIRAFLETGRIKLKSGDRVLLYTDGVTECFSESGSMFGLAGLERFFRQSGNQGLIEVINDLLKELSRYQVGDSGQHDDVAVVVMEKSASATMSDNGL